MAAEEPLDERLAGAVEDLGRSSEPDQSAGMHDADPISEENPLGLATFLCMLNAPNLEVKALGIDEVTAGAPNGSLIAYTRAAAMLESEEVYAIAPPLWALHRCLCLPRRRHHRYTLTRQGNLYCHHRHLASPIHCAGFSRL